MADGCTGPGQRRPVVGALASAAGVPPSPSVASCFLSACGDFGLYLDASEPPSGRRLSRSMLENRPCLSRLLPVVNSFGCQLSRIKD